MSTAEAGELMDRNLYASQKFGYHLLVDAKKALNGFSSLLEFAAKSRNRTVRGFFHGTTLGGVVGRASALPVFAPRVPRSANPTALPPDLAVGRQILYRTLEINMKINTSLGTSALLASDLLVQISPRWISRFSGTSAQLVAENLIPPDFAWPQGTKMKTWQAGGYKYSVCRCRIPGVKGPISGWASGDYWVLNYRPTEKDYNFKDHMTYTKKLELAAIVHLNTHEWIVECMKAAAAKHDARYMAFRDQLTCT